MLNTDQIANEAKEAAYAIWDVNPDVKVVVFVGIDGTAVAFYDDGSPIPEEPCQYVNSMIGKAIDETGREQYVAEAESENFYATCYPRMLLRVAADMVLEKMDQLNPRNMDIKRALIRGACEAMESAVPHTERSDLLVVATRPDDSTLTMAFRKPSTTN